MQEADFQYRIIRSARRTISVQILDDGGVLVRCPLGMGESQIRAFVESKRKWIQSI